VAETVASGLFFIEVAASWAIESVGLMVMTMGERFGGVLQSRPIVPNSAAGRGRTAFAGASTSTISASRGLRVGFGALS